jgi:hypothetical protein
MVRYLKTLSVLILLLASRVSAQPIVIDHATIQNFPLLSVEDTTAIQALRVLYVDRSVGDNISNGLTCLGFASDSVSPTICRRPHPVAAYQLPRETWSRAYPRTTITVAQWNTFTQAAFWYDIPTAILAYWTQHLNDYDVFLFNISYLEVVGDATAYFGPPIPGRANIVDLESWISAHPDKKVIFVTPSTSRENGSQVMTDFLSLFRTYMQTRGSGVLWDVAAIGSHTPNGNACYDNRDGVYYEFPAAGTSENWPDDGHAYEAVCQNYVVDPDGGHISNPSNGMVREAKGLWLALNAVRVGNQQTPDTEPPAVTLNCYGMGSSQAALVVDAQDNQQVMSLQLVGDKIQATDLSGNTSLTPPIHCP